jgi:hypothetical protein
VSSTAVQQSALDHVKAVIKQLAGVAGTKSLISEFMRDPLVPPTTATSCWRTTAT